jgi:hypothetical protein
MNDLENRVRAALHEHANNLGVRTMPSVTREQVRKREARFVATVSVLAASAIALGALLVQALPHAAPSRDVAADGFTSPLEEVPPGWPVVDIGDPAEGYVPFPDADYVVGRKHVMASGTVDDAPFSLVGFLPRDEDEGRGCFEYAPPWSGRPGSSGVMGSCVGSPDTSVPNEADLDLLGFSTEPNSRIEADMGFVSPRVVRLSIHPAGGSAFPIPILEGPEGWDVRFFLTFFYEGIEGDVVAYAADGTVLARSSLCAIVGHSGSCRGSLQQIAPLPE